MRIIGRLRREAVAYGHNRVAISALLMEAADEIERLKAIIDNVALAIGVLNEDDPKSKPQE